MHFVDFIHLDSCLGASSEQWLRAWYSSQTNNGVNSRSASFCFVLFFSFFFFDLFIYLEVKVIEKGVGGQIGRGEIFQLLVRFSNGHSS